jgi:light-regulated signal transduction histidine kinase (bacteriophytochrome)
MQEGAKKGIPATADALKMYAQRVLRPGQVQAFGVVMLVGSVASVGLTGASPGTILAVSANCEKLMGLRPEAVMVGHTCLLPDSCMTA